MPLTFGSAEADGVHAVPSMLLTKLQPFTNSPVKISEAKQLEVGRQRSECRRGQLILGARRTNPRSGGITYRKSRD